MTRSQTLARSVRRAYPAPLVAAGLVSAIFIALLARSGGLLAAQWMAIAAIAAFADPALAVLGLIFAIQYAVGAPGPDSLDSRPLPWFAIHVVATVWRTGLATSFVAMFLPARFVLALGGLLLLLIGGDVFAYWGGWGIEFLVYWLPVVVGVLSIIVKHASNGGEETPEPNGGAGTHADQSRFRIACGLALIVVVVAMAQAMTVGAAFNEATIFAAGLLIAAAVIRRWGETLSWLLLLASVALALLIGEQVLIGSPPGTAPLAPAAVSSVSVLIATLYAGSAARRAWHHLDRLGVVLAIAVFWVVIGRPAIINELVPATFDSDVFRAINAVVPAQITYIVGVELVFWAPWSVGLLLVVAGLYGDAVPVLSRTRHRWHDQGGDPIRIMLEELAPGGSSRIAAAVARERAELAADLHADVLPLIAVARADAGQRGDTETADRLGVVEEEVRGLIMERRHVVLEELGLTHALEWLAERVEGSMAVRVMVSIADGKMDGRPPRQVERAAFRVAQLAVENARAHSGAGQLMIELLSEPKRLDLAIIDHGPGLADDAEAAAARRNRSGLVDMRLEAEGVGATLSLESLHPAGTRVAFRWPSQ
jgi:signal transduction histidine kinase